MTFKTSRPRAISAGLGTTATSLAVLILATGGAFAQDAGVETITVTGFRASLENTIALKKDSTQIVEAVSAEDIGKLPDQSIAEAISRLPGLTAQRLNGRAQDISIRGLSPDFSTTLLNGREQVSTSNNRSAQYDQYPAELMSGVVVYKTPQADLVGQGLSGTVDMRTVRPLDYDHQVISVNARGEGGSLGKLNPQMSMYGYRVSGTYIDQYAGGKLGLTLGVAVMDSPQQFIESNSWGWTGGNGNTVPSADLVSGGVKLQANTDDLVRESAMATVQYRPTDNFESTLDLFFTKYKDHQEFVRNELPLYSWGGDGAGNTIDLVSGFTVNNGMVTAGTFTTSAGTGVKGVLRQEADRHNNDLFAIGWKNQYTAGNWTWTLDAAHSSVQRFDQYFESYAGTGRAGFGATDPMSFTFDKDYVGHFTPHLDYGDYATMLLTSSQGWGGYNDTTGEGVRGGQDGYLNYQHIHDHLTTARLDANYDLHSDVISKITFGVAYANRHKAMTPEQYYIGTTDDYTSYSSYVAAHGNGTGWVPVSTVIPEKYRFGDSGGLSYFGIPKIISWDSEALLRDGIYTKSANVNADVTSQNWRVDEMVYTGFVKADIDTALYSVPIVGNVGVQYVHTHQSSGGFGVSNTPGLYNHALPVSGKVNYDEFLPSLNLTAKLDDENQIRIGAARELVRARMDQMSASNEFGYNTSFAGNTDLTHTPWSGTVGNPSLRPWLAEAVDVSYEWYFGKAGYLSVAGFYKDLETYIYQKSTLFDFSNYIYTGLPPALMQGYVKEYVNGSGGQLQGVEVSFALAGETFSEYLEGFGVTANASYTDSSIQQNPENPKTPLPGLSKDVYNVTLYYERAGFSVRLNESYRSKFLGEVTGYGAGLASSYIKSQGWLDGQIGYEFQSGSLQGMSVLFQVNNITDETQVSYNVNLNNLNDTRQVLDWQRYGRQFLFGITYKLN